MTLASTYLFRKSKENIFDLFFLPYYYYSAKTQKPETETMNIKAYINSKGIFIVSLNSVWIEEVIVCDTMDNVLCSNSSVKALEYYVESKYFEDTNSVLLKIKTEVGTKKIKLKKK